MSPRTGVGVGSRNVNPVVEQPLVTSASPPKTQMVQSALRPGDVFGYAKAALANLLVGSADIAVHGAAYGVASYSAPISGLSHDGKTVLVTRGSKLPDDQVVKSLMQDYLVTDPQLNTIERQNKAIETAEDAGMAGLATAGFRGIVGFTLERDYDSAAAKAHHLNNLYLPMEDMGTPTREQVADFLKFIADPANQPVYIHCEAGQGRTGVMAGVAEIVFGGKTADQVIKEFADTAKVKGSPNFTLKLRSQRDFLKLFEQVYRSQNSQMNYSMYGFPPPKP